MSLVKIFLAILVGIPLLLGGAALYVYMQIPSTEMIRTGCFKTQMNEVQFCPSSKDYVKLSQISNLMKKTVILTEDSLFYQHKGFDWESIEKSAKENMEKGKYIRGGSTITQQLAKNLFLSKEKSLHRKFMEGLITLKLERTLSKNEILEKYLNVIEFGKGIFGIKAASWHYFKKSPSGLTAAESAFLAMLLPNPVKYSSSFHRKELTRFAESRIRKILTDMYRYHRIDQMTYEEALIQMTSLVSPENMRTVAPQLEQRTDDIEVEGEQLELEPAPAPLPEGTEDSSTSEVDTI